MFILFTLDNKHDREDEIRTECTGFQMRPLPLCVLNALGRHNEMYHITHRPTTQALR
jgi:hypothetical protein